MGRVARGHGLGRIEHRQTLFQVRGKRQGLGGVPGGGLVRVPGAILLEGSLPPGLKGLQVASACREERAHFIRYKKVLIFR